MVTNMHPKPQDEQSESPSTPKAPSDVTLDVASMDNVVSKFKWGNANGTSSSGQLIHLSIQGYDKPLLLDFAEEIILGRFVVNGDKMPVVDLTPYGGVEKGISRTHAAIQRMKNAIVIVDLGSVNKTFINGQRIASYQPHILVEGDEIRLGNLIANVSFRQQDEAKI